MEILFKVIPFEIKGGGNPSIKTISILSRPNPRPPINNFWTTPNYLSSCCAPPSKIFSDPPSPNSDFPDPPHTPHCFLVPLLHDFKWIALTCIWSPASTIRVDSAANVNGIIVSHSIACAASSTKMWVKKPKTKHETLQLDINREPNSVWNHSYTCCVHVQVGLRNKTWSRGLSWLRPKVLRIHQRSRANFQLFTTVWQTW